MTGQKEKKEEKKLAEQVDAHNIMYERTCRQIWGFLPLLSWANTIKIDTTL